jgi:phage head maturation protease
MGALDSMSIGTIIHDYQPVEKDKPFGGWNITKAEVIEGSVVTVPANDQAVIQNVKSFEADEKQLKDLVKSAVNEAFKKERLLNILENC